MSACLPHNIVQAFCFYHACSYVMTVNKLERITSRSDHGTRSEFFNDRIITACPSCSNLTVKCSGKQFRGALTAIQHEGGSNDRLWR